MTESPVIATRPVNVAPVRRVPIRTCVACRTTGGKKGLLRVVRLPEGTGVAVDPTGKKSGRGAYVCPTKECIALALKRKALERSLKIPITDEVVKHLLGAVAIVSPSEPASAKDVNAPDG